MFLKKILLVVIISLAITIFVSSCGKTETDKTPATEQGVKESGTASADAKLSVEGNVIKLTGAGEKSTPKFTMVEAVYVATFKYKGEIFDKFDALIPSEMKDFPAMGIVPYSAVYKGADGWCVCSKVMNWQSGKSETSLDVKSKNEWEITFAKLPLSGEAPPAPVTLTGQGTNVAKVFTLKKGSATFVITCPDTKKAGFAVTLYDGTSGENISPGYILASNVENIADSKNTNFTATKKVEISADGVYLLEVGANGGSTWEIKVSQ